MQLFFTHATIDEDKQKTIYEDNEKKIILCDAYEYIEILYK